jgi:hypothetical protein
MEMNTTSYDVQNMYEVLDEKYLDRPRHFDNESRIHCELLSRYLIVGSTASMKTNSAIQIMLAHGRIWDTFSVCCLSLDEPLYRWLQDYVAEEQRQGRVKWAIFCTDLKQLPPLHHYEKEKHLNHYCLIDDMINSSKKDLKLVDLLFMKSRKAGLTVHVLSQDWTRIPLFWRRNFTYAVFKSINARQLKRIAGDVTSDVTPNRFVELYQQAIQRKQDWFFVDKSCSSQGNLSLMFRRNLG